MSMVETARGDAQWKEPGSPGKRMSSLVHERLRQSEWGRKIMSEVHMHESDATAWVRYQKGAFTLWINARLANAPTPMTRDVVVSDLFRDMRNGTPFVCCCDTEAAA